MNSIIDTLKHIFPIDSKGRINIFSISIFPDDLLILLIIILIYFEKNSDYLVFIFLLLLLFE